MSDDEDDPTLCEKARQGCEQAFAALFHRHYAAVHGFAFRLCLDSGGAEDVAQEAFIKAARSLASFRNEASFKNWLYRIAMNTAHDWNRRKMRERTASEELEARGSDGERPADFEPVRAALADLAEDLRQTVVLIYFEGMNHAQAARLLGCAETTVSWRIFRAKRQLKEVLSRPIKDLCHE